MKSTANGFVISSIIIMFSIIFTAKAGAVVHELVVHYDMSYKNGFLIDVTGSGHDAECVGFTENDFIEVENTIVLNFPGDKAKYVKLPDGIIFGETFTIETKFKTNTAANHWLYALGTKHGNWPNVFNYIFLNPRQSGGTIRFGIKDVREELLFQRAAINPDNYNVVAAAFKPGKILIYLNGEFVGDIEHNYSVVDILAKGAADSQDCIGYIGRSIYNPDPAFTGQLAYFKVYNYTLSAPEIKRNYLKETDGLLAHYDMSYKNGLLIDITNNGFDAECVGCTEEDFTTEENISIGFAEDFIAEESIAVLNFAKDESKYIKLPQGLITDGNFTIETRFKAGIEADHWLDIYEIYDFDFNSYHIFTAALREGLVAVYLDGQLVSAIEHNRSIKDMLAITADSEDCIGYPAFVGQLADFKVYNYTLSAEEIERKIMTDEKVLSLTKANLAIPHADDIRGNITLPTVSELGAQITWLTDRPDVVTVNEIINDDYDNTPPGVVTRQNLDTQVTLTAVITYKDLYDTKEIPIMVKAAPKELTEEDYKGYLFAYFTGEGYEKGEQIYFALSTDGFYWQEFNYDKPELTSDVGEKGVRDPFTIRSPEGDKFYIIATDLRIYNGAGWSAAQTAGSKSIVVWESTDLVNWFGPRLVKVAGDDAGCTWAPEAVYDEKTGEYIVFWASRIGEDDFAKQRIYFAKTRDFYTFTTPKVYLERERDVIDSTIIEHNGVYYRFSKDEVQKNIIVDKCHQLLGRDFEKVAAPAVESQRGVEGPAVFKLNGVNQWVLLLDQYGGRGYYPLITDDLAAVEFRPLNNTEYKMPAMSRHGSVIPITKNEYDVLLNK